MIRTEEFNFCVLCNSKGSLLYEGIKDRLFSAEGVYNYYFCNWCKFAWLNPRPIKEDISLCYKEYYTHKAPIIPKETNRIKKIIKEKIIKCLLSFYCSIPVSAKLKRSELILGKILSLFPYMRKRAGIAFPIIPKWYSCGKLLDIGCGNGYFLYMMKKVGWDVYGVEIDEKAANYAKKNYNLPIFIGSLEEANFSKGFFDVITMNHIIEHVYNPITLLRKAHEILIPGGYIYLRTPNLESLAHKLFKSNCFFLDAPRHLWLWSKNSIVKIFEREKFNIVKNETSNFYAATIYDQSKLIKKQGRADLNRNITIAGKIFSKFEHLLKILKIDIGEDIYLIARKRN